VKIPEFAKLNGAGEESRDEGVDMRGLGVGEEEEECGMWWL